MKDNSFITVKNVDVGSLYQIHIESRSCKKMYVPHFLILKVTIFDRVVLEAERFQPWNDMF